MTGIFTTLLVKTSNFATQGNCPLLLIQSSPDCNLNENKMAPTENSVYRIEFDRNLSEKYGVSTTAWDDAGGFNPFPTLKISFLIRHSAVLP